MVELKELLDERIRGELEALTHLNSGSEEKQRAVDDVVKLYKLTIDEQKNELEKNSQYCTSDVQSCELRGKNFDRFVKIGLELVAIAAPLVFYGIWMGVGLKFEETGTFTSPTVRGLTSNFKPKR